MVRDIVVQKFGGSSVGTVERIKHVAERVAKARETMPHLVVVVSAMRGETDRLLALANEVAPRPDPRETDALVATGEQVSAAALAIALRHRGIPAISMSGAQMLVRTDGMFSRARIKHIDRSAIDKALLRGEVVVATGFQGVDDHGNLTTLGRGGSDTSAVALAAALDAKECEIYTDVLGVYTADPNICPDAKKLDVIAFEEMMEMASAGSKVLQIRSVELGMNHNVPVRVRSTFSDDPGTLVTAEDEHIERLVVRGVSHDTNDCKVTVRKVPDRPGVAATLFAGLGKSGINIDVIVQNASEDGTTDVSFTVARADAAQAEELVRAAATQLGGGAIEVDHSIAKVSIVGVGMRAHAGVAAEMFQALHESGVNIGMITTSEIKVTCVIKKEQVQTAVKALHARFELDRGGRKAFTPPTAKKKAAKASKAAKPKSVKAKPKTAKKASKKKR